MKTRSPSELEAAMAEYLAKLDEDASQTIIVCAGPPACPLEGEVALRAQEAGCQWCKRIRINPDGSETVTEPGHA